ncbi:efflux RND transporter permease subunit [Desulfobacterota bacterium M19]
MKDIGISGVIAKAFIKSKLTPLLVIAALLLGVYAIMVTPREEDPQINVPMIDVMLSYPGASAAEVETRVSTPVEKLLWEIKGVKYIYSIAKPGMNLTIIRFKVGEDMNRSLVKVYSKLMSHYDEIPPGVSRPLIKPRSIYSVPILALTLWNPRNKYSSYELRRMADELANRLKRGHDVAQVAVTGGLRRQVRITLNPLKLRAYHLSALQIMGSIQQSDVKLPSGTFPSGNHEFLLETGSFFKDLQDIKKVVVAVADGKPVYLDDVASLTDGPAEPADYVFMGSGPAAAEKGVPPTPGMHPAVTIALSKKRGANATVIARNTIAKVKSWQGTLLPDDVQVTVTRDYGKTANDKSDSLLEHLLIATISVTLLIALALGWRESLVVAVAVPVTLALTLLISYLYGYTLNRVTLFALIFSIGILVDDAIVVVENIYRHFQMHKVSVMTAVRAVDEVGSPTILATFAVIAALLPMAFVSGLMGPYMRPIPVNASTAMIFSLMVAFIVTPWLSYKVLKKVSAGKDKVVKEEDTKIYKLYAGIIGPLLRSSWKRYVVLGSILIMLILVVILVPLQKVTLKMLPFDNKSELQVVINMPEGTSLEGTAELTRKLADYLKTVPEVTDFESYVGTSAPYNFNGLVRHYFLRQSSNLADIQVNLVDKEMREDQSHEIARRIRPPLKKIADAFNARIKVVEIPPGPPVLSPLVAEIYGPDLKRQRQIAARVKHIFATTPGVVDIDWYVEDTHDKYVFVVDKEKAVLYGISPAAVARTLRIAVNGMSAGLLHDKKEKEPVDIMLRMPLAVRSSLAALRSISLPDRQGNLVSLNSLVKVEKRRAEQPIYHKNLKRVTYVIGNVAGVRESPVYAILQMKDRIAKLKLPEGYGLRQYFTEQPPLTKRYSLKWDGAWQITYEVFRDLGIAFAAVMVLIYILVVAWFRSFTVPLVIMAPIPLTLVGILPAHWLFGIFFTATSMIGFIALSGIVVRNSILLVDFIHMDWVECGQLVPALIKAGAVRLRPIVLTAAAVVVGSIVMLFDPIFQGLGVAMMAGAIVATGLTLVIVPLLYFEFFKHASCPVGSEETD